MDKNYRKIIVVGAGIAGLTAAWELKKSGIDALVLEADHVVGGRMQSVIFDDAIIDCGAQFLSSAYTIIPKLIQETGLIEKFVATSEWTGLVKNNNIALIHPRKPWSLVSSHILSIWDLIRLGFRQLKFLKLQKKNFSLSDITAWADYDNQLASEWIADNFGEVVARELTSAMFNGFYFQSLNHSSASLAAAIVAFSAYKPRTMTLTSGMGTLPTKLADQLAVKTNVVVSSICETSTGVKISSNAGEFNCDHAIVTVPAPIAKNIIQPSDEETSLLFETTYSSSILIALLTFSDWEPPSKIYTTYGFVFNPKFESKIAALTIENNKCHTRKQTGYLIHVMLSDKWAKEYLQLSDEEIYRVIQHDVEKILPTIYANLQAKKIFKWEYAMPCTPVGRAKAVKKYRETRDGKNRIWLAGDYLGLPWTDSAAETGLWSANQILQVTI